MAYQKVHITKNTFKIVKVNPKQGRIPTSKKIVKK